MKEQWNPVVGSRLHEVSNTGKIRSIITKHILTPSIDRYGYYKFTSISHSGTKIYKTVHRAVAEAWIINSLNKPQVNHIDGNKLNNNIDNLEWCTNQENIDHSFALNLSKNKIEVSLFNKETNEIMNFRSIKELGKFIDIFPSTLIPLIKNSETNPIFNKYIIKIKNTDAFSECSNTRNFGRKIYVYDLVTGELTHYSSILMAAYFTGIRSLANESLNEPYSKIGYIICSIEEKINKDQLVDKDLLLVERIEYLNIPYRKRDNVYYLYNYYSKVEKEFKTIDDIISYLNTEEPRTGFIRASHISTTLSYSARTKRTGLIKGFGVKTSLHDFPWHPYTEEIILCNKYGLPAPVRVYKIIFNSNEEIVFGILDLCNRFNYGSDKPLRDITHQEVLESLDIPNLNILRLNAPIG